MNHSTNGERLFPELCKVYDHPSIIVWKGSEARAVLISCKKIKLGRPVLDLGCGDGKASYVLFKDMKFDVGIDVSIEEVLKAKRSRFYGEVMAGDATNLPFSEESFGTIFSNCVLHLISDVDRVLDEVSRLLYEEGILIFTVPSDRFGDCLFASSFLRNIGLRKLADWYIGKRNQSLRNYHCYSPTIWKKKIKEKGLSIIEFKYYLNKSAVQIWDLLALFVFAIKVLRLQRFLSVINDEFKAYFLKRIFEKFYTQDYEIGGGLLIISKKESKSAASIRHSRC